MSSHPISVMRSSALISRSASEIPDSALNPTNRAWGAFSLIRSMTLGVGWREMVRSAVPEGIFPGCGSGE